MGDVLEATGFVYVDFRRNNHVVHVRLDYHVEYTKQGYNFKLSPNTRDEGVLMKLKQPKIKAKLLRFIMDQITARLPSTGKLEFLEIAL